MKEEEKGGPNRELYALLNISPEASDEEIRKAYRQWAQVYHPDKYQAAQVLYFIIPTIPFIFLFFLVFLLIVSNQESHKLVLNGKHGS